MKKMLSALMVFACVFAAGECRAETAANIGIDWRGLLHVGEVLRDGPKVNYGFVNFVAFGPGWQYTAQDYAAKEHKKGTVDDPKYGKGLLFTGKIWAGGSGLAIREEFFDISKGGPAKAHVRWKISSLNGKPMGLERAYIRFPLSVDYFAGGKVNGAPLPEKFGSEWIAVGNKTSIEAVSKNGDRALRLAVTAGAVAVQDSRKDKADRFEVRIEFPNKGLKVWALAPDGTRLRQISAVYEGGVYRFTAKIAAGEGANAPTMMYELAM